jgi:hypothetical protein
MITDEALVPAIRELRADTFVDHRGAATRKVRRVGARLGKQDVVNERGDGDVCESYGDQ